MLRRIINHIFKFNHRNIIRYNEPEFTDQEIEFARELVAAGRRLAGELNNDQGINRYNTAAQVLEQNDPELFCWDSYNLRPYDDPRRRFSFDRLRPLIRSIINQEADWPVREVLRLGGEENIP